jgi:endonuclease III
MSERPSLGSVLERLERVHGRPAKPRPRNPFEWVVWENVAYLADDERRAEAFRRLEKLVGLEPAAIGAARVETLAALAAGMRPEERAERLRTCAELALEIEGPRGPGDLSGLLARPLAEALKVLRRFPGIGEPGAEKILMHCGAFPGLALESNGMRTLLRLGFGREERSYAASYRSVRAALDGALPAGAAALARAHALLREHGQRVCRSAPRCQACPLAHVCPSASELG